MTDPARDVAAAYFGKPDAELGDIEYRVTVRFDDSTWFVTKDGWELIERHAPRRLFPWYGLAPEAVT